MKIIPSLAVTILLSTQCIAQNVITDTTATVLAYWNKGDKAKYSLKMTKEKYGNGKKISGGTSESDIDIMVADATDSTYTLHWKYSKINLPGYNNSDPLIEKLTKLVEGITFKYLTEQDGSFKALVNYKEVQKAVNTSLDDFLKMYPQKERAMIEQVKTVFTSRESIEELIMKDVQLVHNLYGGEYKLHEKLTAETQLPNVLGGNPFPAILTIEMVQLDKLNKTCTINLDQVLDAEKAAKEVGAFLDKTSNPPLEKLPDLDISDKYAFEVDLVTGWMKKVLFTRTAAAEGKKNVEIHEITKL
ncbi:MAG: hypothetical protein V4685_02640 [Bacteroidota bacterium]